MVKHWMCALGVLTAVPALAQDRQIQIHTQTVELPPRPPPPMGPPASGLPPALVEKLNISTSQQQKIQDLTYESNDALITLEAEHKRAQLALEKELHQTASNEATVKELVERVGRAETAVRQNRVGLMLSIKKLLGPELWQKVEAEMGPGGSFAPRPPAPPAPPAPPMRPAPPAPPAPPAAKP